jgi:hypothetical protein
MSRAFALLFLVLTMAAAPAAHAQLGGLPVPQVPSVGGVLNDTQQGLRDTVDGSLEDVRRLRTRDLLRENRRVLEADPNGFAIVRSQILAIGASGAALEAARAAGFEIVRSDAIDDDLAVVTLRAPRGMSTRRALRRLRQADPEGVYDFDHLHLESGANIALPAFAQASAARAGPRIGLIDTGVNDSVGVAARRGFASAAPVAGNHGSVIADLLSSAGAAPAGRNAGDEARGLRQRSRLCVSDEHGEPVLGLGERDEGVTPVGADCDRRRSDEAVPVGASPVAPADAHAARLGARPSQSNA